jgi:hypothetical protein
MVSTESEHQAGAQPDAGVQWVVYGLEQIQYVLNAPRQLLERLSEWFVRGPARQGPVDILATWQPPLPIQGQHHQWISAPINPTPRTGAYFNYAYVVAWMTVVAGCLVGVRTGTGGSV